MRPFPNEGPHSDRRFALPGGLLTNRLRKDRLRSCNQFIDRCFRIEVTVTCVGSSACEYLAVRIAVLAHGISFPCPYGLKIRITRGLLKQRFLQNRRLSNLYTTGVV